MKKGIHPKYVTCKVTCACGNTFEVESTKSELHVETCSQCHPAYTGEQKNVAKRGRAEQFNRKYGLDKKED